MSLAFLAPAFLWALLALPLVVLLHFLRTRRRSKVVSALFLWRQASESADARRRYSPTWLLLLQLLFVTLAALALARPVFSLQAPADRVIVIDASASMAARDEDGVRVDKARRAAVSLLQRGGRVAIVRAGLESAVLQPLTEDLATVRRVLDGIVAGDRSADLERALDLARSLAPEGELHLISDVAPPTGPQHQFYPVAGNGINYGITAFETSLGQAYVAVASNDPRPRELDLELRRDGREVARTTLLVPARGQGNVSFPVDEAAGYLEARLRLPEADALPLDDVAWAGSRELVVAVSDLPAQLRRALEAIPGVSLRMLSDASSSAADAVVHVGELDEVPDRGNVLLFSARSEAPDYVRVRDWDQGDPLLRFVDLRDVVVGLPPEAEAELDGEWRVVARATDLRPVIARQSRENGVLVRAWFHPTQSDIVFRPAFPAFVANVVETFRREEIAPLGAPLPEGSTLDGQSARAALVPGIYDTPAGPVAVSLLSTAETRLPAPVGNETQQAEQAPAGGPRAREAVGWLLLGALALLLLEWLAWSRSRAGWLRSS